MSTFIKSIDVAIPVSTAFEEWTRFEDLPRFMRGAIAVQRLDDRRLSWRARILGAEKLWELQITEVVPWRIAWCSRSGPRNDGSVVLQSLSPTDTLVTMLLRCDPQGFVQGMTDQLMLGRWVERSLSRFKEVMEQPHSSLGQLPPADQLVGQ
jgi:uncharacterized membrane protein